MAFFQKILSERDRMYMERSKVRHIPAQGNIQLMIANQSKEKVGGITSATPDKTHDRTVWPRLRGGRGLPTKTGKFTPHFRRWSNNGYPYRVAQAMTGTRIELRSKRSNSVTTCSIAKSIPLLTSSWRLNWLGTWSSYLISTAIANGIKAKFYDEDLPKLENVNILTSSSYGRLLPSLTYLWLDRKSVSPKNKQIKPFSRRTTEALQRQLVERFVKVLIHSQELDLKYLEGLKTRTSNVDAKLRQVHIEDDQDLFIDYNLRIFKSPDDWTFEPCSIHYDTVCHDIFSLAASIFD